MNQRGHFRCSAAILTFALTITVATTTVSATDLGIDPTAAPPPIPDVWARADGPAVRTGDHQSWVWGPAIHSVTHEPYVESPGGARMVFYFDKARMEINDPTASWASPWYATSGLLVKEMILGQVQVGDAASITTAPADIPVTGDLLDNPASPTYASLARHTTIGHGNADRRAEPRIGVAVTEQLHRDGSVQTGVGGEYAVTIAEYGDLLGHNIPALFWDWMNQQPLDWDYLVGHPITEPFWASTRVAGVEQLVLVQAFERRVLTYTPGNPAEWQIEAGNAGLHYRAWRDLSMPADQSLVPLAFSLPLGEIITSAALDHGVDPYLFAALALEISNFDPHATLASDRIGAFGVPIGYAQQQGAAFPFDPTTNANLAAALLAALYAESGDWRAATQRYLSWTDGVQTVSSVADPSADDVMVAWEQIQADFKGRPYPFPEVDQDGLIFVGAGEAAFYSSSYTSEWFDDALARHASWGNAVEGWQVDPNGYYCVHPDYKPGSRLQLSSNHGVTLWCTVGDSVGTGHVSQWRSRWAIEVSWDTFVALGLLDGNYVEVRAAPR